MTLHQRQVHPDPVRGCYGCKVSTVRMDISRLKRDNRAHRTQAELGRETVRDAEKTGVPIQSTKRWI